MTPLEATYRDFVNCLNERRWGELGTFLHSGFAKNEQQYTPESFAAEMQANGDAELEVSFVTVDEGSQRLASTILMRWKPSKQVMGLNPPEKSILVVEKHLNWFVQGKLSKTISLADREGIHRQLSDPQAIYTPDLITTGFKNGAMGTSQPIDNLEDVYRTYLACINERTIEANWERFVGPQVIYNGKTLTLDVYRQMMQDVITAIPDLFIDLHTIIADEKAQRVAVRLEATGTPTQSLASVATTGSQGRFAEHLTYQFRDGKIACAWSIADWGSHRQLVSE